MAGPGRYLNLPHQNADHVELPRSEEHTSELQSQFHLVCRLLLEKKKKNQNNKQHRNRLVEVTNDVPVVDSVVLHDCIYQPTRTAQSRLCCVLVTDAPRRVRALRA